MRVEETSGFTFLLLSYKFNSYFHYCLRKKNENVHGIKLNQVALNHCSLG